MATAAAAVAADDGHGRAWLWSARIFSAALHLTYVLSLIGDGFYVGLCTFGVDDLFGCFCRVLHGFFATY